ncbi:MAG: hypothetical protein HRU25_08215 [Psychrobium sp.]|nr:hypothetical protein [Psychrobium sp.]
MSLLAGSFALASTNVSASDLSIEITNLTHGIHFTPFLVASHDGDTHLFKSGTMASTALQMMAEGGDISALSALVTAAGGQTSENPGAGLLAPGKIISAFDFDTKTDMYLSLTAMLLPTNDGFAGLDSWKIPTTAGTYVVLVNAYDAGTEGNNELIVEGAGAPNVLGIPADPSMKSGSGGSGLTTMDENTMIHIHRGALGDDDATGGKSDLNNMVHRWLNPVLKVTIVVK